MQARFAAAKRAASVRGEGAGEVALAATPASAPTAAAANAAASRAPCLLVAAAAAAAAAATFPRPPARLRPCRRTVTRVAIVSRRR